MRISTGHFMCFYVAVATTSLMVRDTCASPEALIDDFPGPAGPPADSVPADPPSSETKRVENVSIDLKFSLLAEDGCSDIGTKASSEKTSGDDTTRRHDVLTAHNVENWYPPKLVSSVVFSVAHVLCHETSFAIIVTEGEDVCKDSAQMRENGWEMESEDLLASIQQEELNMTSIALIASLKAYDRSKNVERSVGPGPSKVNCTHYALNWTEWRVSFPVLSIGSQYQKQAVAVALMEDDAQIGLNTWIANGNFDSLLLEDDQTILKSSLVGSEEKFFMPAIQDFSSDGGCSEPNDSAPFNLIRFMGIIIGIGTLTIITFLMILARNRKRERELDEEHKKRGRGGLVTEEGLSHMLETGKREALKMTNEQQKVEEAKEVEPPKLAPG